MGEMIKFGITLGFAIALGVVFFAAINTLITMLSNLIFGNFIGEALGIISMCLPFDAGAVFHGFQVVISGVLAFLIAKKIWELTGTTYKIAN